MSLGTVGTGNRERCKIYTFFAFYFSFYYCISPIFLTIKNRNKKMKYLKIIILIILIMYSLFASFYIFSNKKTIRTQNENIIYYRTQNDSLLFLVKKLSEIPAINVEATAKIELTNKAVFGKITANNNEIQAIIKDCTVMIKDSVLNHKNGRK